MMRVPEGQNFTDYNSAGGEAVTHFRGGSKAQSDDGGALISASAE